MDNYRFREQLLTACCDSVIRELRGNGLIKNDFDTEYSDFLSLWIEEEATKTMDDSTFAKCLFNGVYRKEFISLIAEEDGRLSKKKCTVTLDITHTVTFDALAEDKDSLIEAINNGDIDYGYFFGNLDINDGIITNTHTEYVSNEEDTGNYKYDIERGDWL